MCIAQLIGGSGCGAGGGGGRVWGGFEGAKGNE